MAVDNDVICVMFTPSNVCYLCVLSDVHFFLQQTQFSRTHHVPRDWLSTYWDSNFTQIIGPSHFVILHNPARVETLKSLLVVQ